MLTLLRRALALFLALNIAIGLGAVPARADMFFDSYSGRIKIPGSKHGYPFPNLPIGPGFTNLLNTPYDLTGWISYHSASGGALTVSAQRIVVPAGNTDQHVYYLLAPLTAGKTYTFAFSFKRASGSGAGQPRANIYGPEHSPVIDTTAAAQTVTDGASVRTKITVTPTMNNTARPGISFPAGVDNGGDFQIYNLSLVEGTSDPYSVNAAAYLPPLDRASQWISSPNWPTGPPPKDASATLSNGLTLEAGSTNVSAIDFRVGTGNVTTRTALNSTFFLHSIFGDIRSVTGLPMDGLNNNYARYRAFPAGHAYDLHTLSVEGLKLGVVGRGNDSPLYKDGEVYAGMIRGQENVLPGMTVEVVWRGPINDVAWVPVWLEQGYQASPLRVSAAGGNPFYSGLLAYMANNGQSGGPYYEIDNCDCYSVSYATGNPPMGTALTAGIIRRGAYDDPTGMVDAPYTDFVASDNGFSYGGMPSIVALLANGVRFNVGFHALVVNWRLDGWIDFIFDGKLFLRQYQEYRADTFVDPIDGLTKKIGLHLVVGGQGIPKSHPLAASNAPVRVANRDTMAATIRSIKIFQGNVAQASIIKPTSGVTQTFSALTVRTPTPVNGGGWTAAIAGVSQNSRIKATAADGQALTVTLARDPNNSDPGSNVTGATLAGAGSSSAALPISLVQKVFGEHGDAPAGLPRTTTVSSYTAATNLIPAAARNSFTAANGWSSNTFSALTPSYGTCSDGTSPSTRWTAPAGSSRNLEFIIDHPNAVQSIEVRPIGANPSTLYHYTGGGPVSHTLNSGSGWTTLSDPLQADFRFNLYESGGGFDVEICKASLTAN